MQQNTAQNNPQFSYPDFSGTGQNNPSTQSQGPGSNQNSQPPQNQQINDDAKIQELRKRLDSLKSEQEKQTEIKDVRQADSSPVKENQPPVQDSNQDEVKELPQEKTPPPAPPVADKKTQEATSPPPSAKPSSSIPKESSETKILDKYIQKPNPLPSMDKKIPSDQIIDHGANIAIPSGEGFDPLPPDLPKFSETLDHIMPDLNKGQEKQSPEEEAQANQQKDLQDLEEISPSKEDLSVEEMTIQKLMSEAINKGASDLHISVGYPPILRIDGDLVNVGEKFLSPQDAERLIFSVLTDERKELLEVNREIDFAYTYEGDINARFRVNAYYSMKNLSAAFRLIPSRVKTIEELKLPQIYNQFAKLKQGLILVTGPTGHGKSTTIAAILEAINRTRFCHIVTIEDPIEYVFDGKKALIDQREMNDDTHSWNIALRSALRQDPDVILVGEMRDFETIASAITAAETGHLVFATLHTNSAAQTLDRIIDVFPENQQQQVRTQVANTLRAVIAQRLIPLQNGGRRAVSEILLNNSAVGNLIREGKVHQIDNVIRTSSDLGMIYLERSLVNLVREGVITVQTAQEYAVHPEEVLRLLKE